jgi:hypothetical protein
MKDIKNQKAANQKDFYEGTFGGYLNWLTGITKEFTLFGVLATYLYLKTFDGASLEFTEEDIEK